MLDSDIPYYFSAEREAFRCHIFRILERTAKVADGTASLPVYTLECADWVHVVPITTEGKCLLVEQYRFGADKLTIEIPGGTVDSEELDLTNAARRELEEETGYTATNLIKLATLSPNPALQCNSLTYFLAPEAHPLPQLRQHHDPLENITVRTIPVTDVFMMISSGTIVNALSVLGLLLAQPHIISM